MEAGADKADKPLVKLLLLDLGELLDAGTGMQG